jgi:hypothetical protein
MFVHVRVVVWRMGRVLALVDRSASEKRKHYQERGATNVPAQAVLPETQGGYAEAGDGFSGLAAHDHGLGGAVLTKDVLFGMNVLTLTGLVLTGFGLNLRRTARIGLPSCIALMGAGTALVIFGLYVSNPSH